MRVFKPDYRGIGKMLANEELLGPALLALAERVKAEAEATAPYEPKSTTHFRDAFHASIGKDETDKGDRVAGIVTNDDPEALNIETGTPRQAPEVGLGPNTGKYRPAHNTLSNALDVLRGG